MTRRLLYQSIRIFPGHFTDTESLLRCKSPYAKIIPDVIQNGFYPPYPPQY